MILKPEKFWKAMDKEAVHVVLWSGHELTEGPECVLLRVEVHEEEGGYLGHALAVAHLRVEHAVGRQHVEQVLLSGVVPLTEHLMITIRPETICFIPNLMLVKQRKYSCHFRQILLRVMAIFVIFILAVLQTSL